MNIDMKAMFFAREKHKNQVRKYTENPYFDHLAEVVGIFSTISFIDYNYARSMRAVAWLHDVIEDTEATYDEVRQEFGELVADGVMLLSDLEEGNRETRKRLSRERLANGNIYVQSIKVADMISNTSSIVKHDPDFAKIYLKEKRLMLNMLTKADPDLLKLAGELCERH